jgi:hypothetical protein
LPDDLVADERLAIRSAVARVVGLLEPLERPVESVERRLFRRRSELAILRWFKRQLGWPGVSIPAAGLQRLERRQPVAVPVRAVEQQRRRAVAISFE